MQQKWMYWAEVERLTPLLELINRVTTFIEGDTTPISHLMYGKPWITFG